MNSTMFTTQLHQLQSPWRMDSTVHVVLPGPSLFFALRPIFYLLIYLVFCIFPLLSVTKIYTVSKCIKILVAFVFSAFSHWLNLQINSVCPSKYNILYLMTGYLNFFLHLYTIHLIQSASLTLLTKTGLWISF